MRLKSISTAVFLIIIDLIRLTQLPKPCVGPMDDKLDYVTHDIQVM